KVRMGWSAGAENIPLAQILDANSEVVHGDYCRRSARLVANYGERLLHFQGRLARRLVVHRSRLDRQHHITNEIDVGWRQARVIGQHEAGVVDAVGDGERFAAIAFRPERLPPHGAAAQGPRFDAVFLERRADAVAVFDGFGQGHERDAADGRPWVAL